MRYAFIFLVLGLFMVSCSVAPLQVAPSTTPITGETSYTILGPAEGSSCRHTLIIPLFSFGSGSLYTAVQNTLSAHGADALINVTVDRHYTFYLIGARSCTSIHGIAIKILSK